MSGVEAFLLGVLQGLTEFLPVSSSGHLVIAESVLGLEPDGILFEVTLHGATLLAVVIFYRERIQELVTGALRLEHAALDYGAKLALATLPAVLATLLFRDFFERQFAHPVVAASCLLGTGLVVWTTRWTLSRARSPALGWGAAWWIGVAQALAILPGISRSGATVATALALGVAPLAAAEFSFLLSVVAVLGAVALQLPELSGVQADARFALAAGGVAALVSGVAALWLFVRLLRTRHFHRFAYYVWAAGSLTLLWLWLS